MVKRQKLMKVILVMVMSVDGKTTRWHNPDIYNWTSSEDQAYFFSLIKKNKVIIMGRKTFMAAKSIIKPSPKNLRIVLTTTPQKYKNLSVPKQLEFSSDSPQKIIKKLNILGITQVLLVGGEHVNNVFFKEKLINEVWLTIEPKIFGVGNGLVSSKKLDIKLQLQKVSKLNNKGTLLLKYQVV